MSELAKKACVPCQGGVPPLNGDQLDPLIAQLDSQWKLVNEHHLERELGFPDFKEALDFVNKAGETAEQEGHHPDLKLGFGYVHITVFTHKIDGLTESDFIFAAKVDELLNK